MIIVVFKGAGEGCSIILKPVIVIMMLLLFNRIFNDAPLHKPIRQCYQHQHHAIIMIMVILLLLFVLQGCSSPRSPDLIPPSTAATGGDNLQPSKW